jgi:hypothetical protein
MTGRHLLDVASSRRDREARRAGEIEASNRYSERRGRRVLIECIALAFLGVPFYAWSWHVSDPDVARVWSALGFAISYAAPFFRWLVYHMRSSDTFG